MPQQKEINLPHFTTLIRSKVLAGAPKALSGTTSETSTGKKLSGTTTETSTGSLATDQTPIVMPFGGMRGADPIQVAKLRDLLWWFE